MFAVDVWMASAWHWMVALGTGAALGFFGGVFGIGGGVIAIPLLVLAYGMDQPLAQGTALVMMVPNLLIAWWRYHRITPAPWPRVLGIGALGTLTTWFMARWATALPPDTLRLMFCAFLAWVGWSMWRAQRPVTPAQGEPIGRLNPRYIPLVGVLGGSSMGLMGIGGGLLATPLLTGWFGLRQAMAQSLALALVAPSAVMALGTYAQAHRVDWQMGLPMALAGTLTVSSGVALATRLPERTLRRNFALMLMGTSVWMAVWPWLQRALTLGR
ncbi:sulfite exporter TauE/SafE family protein [Aquabacterium lacunae]|nr:sulfite exporter TauE/SafE family protein [Aquabacterium lacunae]